MTSLFSARRRAEEFAAAVDNPRRDVSPDLRPLVGVSTALRVHAADQATPRAEFAAELRARLMAEAEQALVPSAPLVLPVRRRGPRERRLVAAASAVVLIGGTASMAAAAQQALPGEALYPIKRTIERAETGLSVSASGKGSDLLHQADGRLAEVERLLASGSALSGPRIPQTLQDFTAQAQQGSGLLLSSYGASRDPDAIVTVRDFTTRGIASLQEIARTAPADAQDELAAAAVALRDIDARATALCATCADSLPPVEVPGIFLAAADAGRALTLVNGRFRLLDNSHPVPVPQNILDGVESGLKGSQQQSPGSEPSAGASSPSPTPGLPVPSETNVDKGKESVNGTVQGTLDGVTGTLNDVVKTLLPEAELDLTP